MKNLTRCIYISQENVLKIDLNIYKNIILFPDLGKTYNELINIDRIEESCVITCSPIICTNYKVGEIYVYKNNDIEVFPYNIYGASLEVACKMLHEDVKSSLSNYIIKEIRAELNKSNTDALIYLDSLSSSGEKAYLIAHLKGKL